MLWGDQYRYLAILEITLRLSMAMWPKCDRVGGLAKTKKEIE